MDFGDLSAWTVVPLQILLVDLLLGADNAVVIALACQRLPPHEVRRATTIGVAGAVIIRILLVLVAAALLQVPFVKLIAASTLLVIALNIVGDEGIEERERGSRPGATLWSAAAIILVADTTMSVDNVVALAAIAQGNIFWLLAGVALSLPIIAYGGVMLATLLRRAPWLIEVGAALLGWIALEMATTDALFGSWLDINAPALAGLAPALGAAFVYGYARIHARPGHEASFAEIAEAKLGPPVAEAADLGLPRSATAATNTGFAPVAEVADLGLPRSATAATNADLAPVAEVADLGPPRSTTAATNTGLAPVAEVVDLGLPRSATAATNAGRPPVAEAADLGPPRSTTATTNTATAATRAPLSRDDRVAIIGVLLLAVAAGLILMVVSYLDSFN